jgi:hypothetical protein
MTKSDQQRITQHKRLMSFSSIYPSDFMPYGTHPNFCFAKTSFMLEPLGAMSLRRTKENLE